MMQQRKVQDEARMGHSDRSRLTLHFALLCQERGFSVLPVCGKTPAIPWKEFQTRRPTVKEIANWFGEKASERFNLGIVTGQVSGLIVIDADTVEDAAFWQKHRPSTPLMVRSGGGGMHFYYQVDPNESCTNRTRVLSRSIDVRGEGGMIVAPPSLHPRTNERYQWVNSFESYCLHDVPVFDPAWIGTKRSTHALPNAATSSGAISNVRAWIRQVKAVSGKRGHDATFRVACKLFDAGLSKEEALLAILDWSAECATPPWSRRELEHKISSAFAVKRQQSGGKPTF